MSKVLKYTKITGQYYLHHSDEWEYDGVDFEYEVEDDDILPEIVRFLFRDYFLSDKEIAKDEERKKSIKEKLKALIVENDLIGWFADIYEDELHDIFEKEAMEFYND